MAKTKSKGKKGRKSDSSRTTSNCVSDSDVCTEVAPLSSQVPVMNSNSKSNLSANIIDMIEDNNKRLMLAISDKLDETRKEQSCELRKLKFKDSYTFKRKANEDQHKFNCEVTEVLNDCKMEIEGKENVNSSNLMNLLSEGTSLLQKRQKLIVLADKSEHGWRTAIEYKRDDLASDSDDEKRIWKANARAGRIHKTSRRGTGRRFGMLTGNRDKRSNAYGYHGSGSGSFQQVQAFGHGNNVGSNSSFRRFGGNLAASTVTTRDRPCWKCGSLDHWQANCPVSIDKISIVNNDSDIDNCSKNVEFEFNKIEHVECPLAGQGFGSGLTPIHNNSDDESIPYEFFDIDTRLSYHDYLDTVSIMVWVVPMS